MNETIGFILGLFFAMVAALLAMRQIIGENQELKDENRAYRKANANLLNGVVTLKQRCTWLESELALDEDAAEQERETP